MLILYWGKLSVRVAEYHQSVACEIHIGEGAPHTEWNHAAFINYDGVLLFILFGSDKAMKEVEDCVSWILDIVDVRHRHMSEGDADHLVAQSLELGSEEADQVTLPSPSSPNYESSPVLHNDLCHLLLEFVIGTSARSLVLTIVDPLPCQPEEPVATPVTKAATELVVFDCLRIILIIQLY